MDGFSTFLEGAIGGTALGLVSLVIALVELTRATVPPGGMKAKQFLATRLLVTVLLAGIGGAVAWALEGRAGNVITGIASLGLVLVLAGDALTALEGKTAEKKATK